jgi:hypothetical protein
MLQLGGAKIQEMLPTMLWLYLTLLPSDVSLIDFALIILRQSNPFIKSPEIFGSIVVSISACHSKEQLAGGRGSIPRQRVPTFCVLFVFLSLPALHTANHSTSSGHPSFSCIQLMDRVVFPARENAWACTSVLCILSIQTAISLSLLWLLEGINEVIQNQKNKGQEDDIICF